MKLYGIDLLNKNHSLRLKLNVIFTIFLSFKLFVDLMILKKYLLFFFTKIYFYLLYFNHISISLTIINKNVLENETYFNHISDQFFNNCVKLKSDS